MVVDAASTPLAGVIITLRDSVERIAARIEAVEYYASPAELPAKDTGYNSACGVLVLWTRRTLDDQRP